MVLYAKLADKLFILANAFSGCAGRVELQTTAKLLREVELLYAERAKFVARLLGVPRSYTLALDRTNQKVGTVDVNLRILSTDYHVI